MAKHKFQPHKIWNCDKTNDLTVNQPQKVIATKGCNQVILTDDNTNSLQLLK